MDIINKRIGELRKKKGVTQDELAEQMGVSPQAVSKWETGLNCPDILILPQLAAFFGVTVDALFHEENEVQLVPKEERKDYSKMIFRINILSGKGDRVRVNLPMPLIKIALEIGTSLPQVANQEALKKIDLNQIVALAEEGVIGRLVEIDSADGDHVEIVVE
jgi:transcriptional regulator with XRE-family HTH domain